MSVNQHVEADAPMSRVGSVFGLGVVLGYLLACAMFLLMLGYAAR